MKVTLFLIKSAFFLLFVSTSYSQITEWPCDEPVHGIVSVDMNCNTENIIITSIPEDGSGGSIINGVIITDGNIIIKPGHTGVVIPPFNTSEFSERGLSRSFSSTKIGCRKNKGNGGDVGLRSSLQDKNTLKTDFSIKTYPNPITNTITITATDTKIVGYELADFYGKTILKQKISPTNKKTLWMANLKKGIYLLKTQTINNNTIIKTIIKQ